MEARCTENIGNNNVITFKHCDKNILYSAGNGCQGVESKEGNGEEVLIFM